MIFRFGKLTITYYDRYKSHMVVSITSAAHAFDYILHRVKFGLTSCEELAMPLLSEAPALFLSFVTLYLVYIMMKLCTGNEIYSRFLLAPLERLLYWSFLASTKHMQTVQA